jgi:hypothetical protein
MWLDIASVAVGGQQPGRTSYPGKVLTMRRGAEAWVSCRDPGLRAAMHDPRIHGLPHHVVIKE